jgi:hypothetical protein
MIYNKNILEPIKRSNIFAQCLPKEIRCSRIRIGNADLDPGVKKLTKMNKKPDFWRFKKGL